MTKKISKLLKNLKLAEYQKQRVSVEGLQVDINKQTENFENAAKMEKAVIFSEDSFGFNRYTDYRPMIQEGNVTANYMRIISSGLDKVTLHIKDSMSKTDDKEKIKYAENLMRLIDICISISDKYRACAKEQKNEKLYQALSKIPGQGAENLYEALVFMKFCIFCLRLYGVSHLTLGRFDQYMYPYYLKEKEKGITDDEILELIEEFFISLNYDTDLYPGIQLGDNGQSIVLGGFDKDGNSMYNELSQICMRASYELSLIDPKINLRVGKNTPDEIYEYATLLTKQGLGFPQYCNDDIVVPGLVKLGYEKADALNYTVAACWEYIIPDCGADIPNFNTMDFPNVVGRVISKKLQNCESFSELMDCVKREIAQESQRLAEEKNKCVMPYVPLLSLFIDGCIENLCDMRLGGAKYMNFGCHGAGIANAADALAAVKKNIYDEKIITKEELTTALYADFEGFTEIKNILVDSPKMGNNDDYVDDIASELMRAFADNMNNRSNEHGGIWRAGTGSAMEYIWKGEQCHATADGRRAGEAYSSSFSPSLNVKPNGLLSIIQSFTKHDMTDIINGGPLTVEIHDSVLRNDIGIKKTAQLVKTFINLGGHQLQLNSINRDTLIDAQKHPEKYPNLIVRVWGWSGYFNELDVKFQNHIIKRCEFVI